MNPPSVFERRFAEIAKVMDDICAESAILDSKRLHKVDQSIDQMQRGVITTEDRYREFQTEIRGTVPVMFGIVSNYKRID